MENQIDEKIKINTYLNIASIIISIFAISLSIYAIKNKNITKNIDSSEKISEETKNNNTSTTVSINELSKEEPNQDVKFQEEYPVEWSGEIISVFVSGEDLAIKRFDGNQKYDKFYVVGNGKYKEDMGNKLKIKGRLVGITCAYKNTVFEKCVGEVEADEITKIE